MPATPRIRAPDDEQSAVGPFFDNSSPECGSFAVPGDPLRPVPLSGRPMPASQAAVTIWLPAGLGAQSAAVPTNVKGTAAIRLSSAAALPPVAAATNSASASNAKIWRFMEFPLSDFACPDTSSAFLGPGPPPPPARALKCRLVLRLWDSGCQPTFTVLLSVTLDERRRTALLARRGNQYPLAARPIGHDLRRDH